MLQTRGILSSQQFAAAWLLQIASGSTLESVMKITDVHNASIVAAQKTRGGRRVDKVAAADTVPVPSDRVFFTQRSTEVNRACLLALQAPEVRLALVDSISEQIRTGQYAVSGADVAPKLIQEHLGLAQV